MTNLIFHEYYYRYRQQRKIVKDIVDTGQYTGAFTKLDRVVSEHFRKYSPELLNTKRDFNFGERAILVHALIKLDTVINYNDPTYVVHNETDIPPPGIIRHISDDVKFLLERLPKLDYTNNG